MFKPVAMGLLTLLLVGVLVPRLIAQGPAPSPTATPKPTPTPTPRPTPTPVPGNILPNPGFEAGKGSKAEDWSMHEGARRTGADVLVGDWAAHISSLAGGAITRAIPVQPNTAYVAQYWQKSGPNGVPGPMYFYIFGQQEKRYIIADGSRLPKPIDWTLRGAYFNSGNNTTVNFELSLSTAPGPVGELFFDETAVFLRPGGQPQPRAALRWDRADFDRAPWQRADLADHFKTWARLGTLAFARP
jgi:hypothetical protein